MRYLCAYLPASMRRCLVLLVIFGLGHVINAASIFHFSDLTRRLPERTTPGCAYKGEKYEHGDRVPTAEPCLNCTCIRAVLVCYLRVCPTASAPPAGCFAAREVGECCPALVCGGADLSRSTNKSDSGPDLRPTFQPIREETTDDSSSVEDTTFSTSPPAYSIQKDTTPSVDDSFIDTTSKLGDSLTDTEQTAKISQTIAAQTVEIGQTDTTQTAESSPTDIVKTSNRSSAFTHQIVQNSPSHTTQTIGSGSTHTTQAVGSSSTHITQTVGSSSTHTTQTVEMGPTHTTKTVVSSPTHTTPTAVSSLTDPISTVSGSTFHTTLSEDDSLVYISSTQEPTQDYDINIFNDIPGGCMVNGTLYGDGSAMLSSSFCEYCFCIRGKSTCLKPKCHLVINGCTPFYDNHYSCCPSRYDCSQRSSTLSDTTEFTTTPSTTLSETTVYTGDCVVDGIVYHQGDVVPDRLSCHNCYCSDSSVVCEKIKCSPPLEGCQPIIPQGHCCPISYRCDYQNVNSGSNNIKGTNNSILSIDSKGTDVKTVKNYFTANDAEVRIKGNTNDKESVALLHNVIPIHRRLDENVYFEGNGTVNIQGELSPVYIGQKVSEQSGSDTTNLTAPIRENDKTLNLELRNSTTVTEFNSNVKLSSENNIQSSSQTTVSDEFSSAESISVGPPEVHTLSIQQLFDQFFSRHEPNTSQLPDEIYVEPKRNNSKQPSSIVKVHDTEDDTSDSITMNDMTTKLIEILETIRDASIISGSTIPEINMFTSAYKDTTNMNDSVSDYVTERSPTNTLKSTDRNIYPHDKVNIENNQASAMFTNTETTNSELNTRTDQESTFPLYLTTKNINQEFSHQTHRHSTLPQSPITKDLNNGDFMEVSPTSQIFTSTRNLYNGNFNRQTETQSPNTNTRNIFSSAFQTDTKPTSPIYTSTRDLYNEDFKTHLETQPTILIYDLTRDVFTDEPKLQSETPHTLLSHGSTGYIYNDEFKTGGTETYLTSPIFTSTRNLYGEGVELTKTSSTSSPYISTKYIASKVKTKPQLLTPIHATTRNIFNEEIELETEPQHASSIYTTTKDLDREEFESQTNSQTVSPTFTIVKKTNSEEFIRETETQPTPTFTSTIKGEHQKTTETNPISQTSSFENFNNKGVTKVVEIHPTIPAFIIQKLKTEEYPTTSSVLPVNINTQSDIGTTQNPKPFTRINSKLPSFSYIEKANEKNNTFYSRFPVLTDSVVNVYLPAESRDAEAAEGVDFTNVGSLYLGAPLSVGGTDIRKDIHSSKPKLTQSGGVIFMDPQYTDIGTRTNFESREKTLRDTISTAPLKQSSSIEKSDQDTTNNERKKGPRIQDTYNQSSTGQGYKIIPFVAEDAVRGQFGKINNSLLVQQGSTPGVPDMVSDFCFVKGRIYMNGEMIGKLDPCELCRCFYGRELCQIQKCPTPPDCTPEKVPGFCCPRFTCGNNASTNEQIPKLTTNQLPVNNVNPNVKSTGTEYQLLSEVTTITTRKPDLIEKNSPSANKQEIKFGIRVKARPTQSPVTRLTEHTAETKIEITKTTTTKPEIRTIAQKTSTTTTTTKKPNIVRTITNKKPEIKRTTTTTQSPQFPDPWGLLKVSGCNIYGKFFNINDQVEILSGPCSHCVCTTNGVECNDIC